MGDIARVAQADAEREFIVRELSRAVGLGGRDRRSASASERARASVTRAVRQAMGRIRQHYPPREASRSRHPHRRVLRLRPRPTDARAVDVLTLTAARKGATFSVLRQNVAESLEVAKLND
jgi:hypothetical protein